jgi:hypothetical protein
MPRSVDTEDNMSQFQQQQLLYNSAQPPPTQQMAGIFGAATIGASMQRS